MTDLARLATANLTRWNECHIHPEALAMVQRVAARLIGAKARYQTVATRTGVPWAVIAVIHERECSQSWLGSLAQGDPWNHVSVHVPAGRGPFKTWEDAAVDALVNCAPHAARWNDWSIGGALTLLEQYNGLGYAARGVPSPYVWSYTDQYSRGKFVSDHHFDPYVVDHQLGCAALLKAMTAADLSIEKLWRTT